MPRRKKPGPRSTGLTVKKNFNVTPKTDRLLARTAVASKTTEADIIRTALDQFFLAQNVREADNTVHVRGHVAELSPA